MKKNQIKGHANQAKEKIKEVSGKVTGNKSTKHKGNVDKHGGMTRAKIRDTNGDAKATKK